MMMVACQFSPVMVKRAARVVQKPVILAWFSAFPFQQKAVRTTMLLGLKATILFFENMGQTCRLVSQRRNYAEAFYHWQKNIRAAAN
jgi:predicted oxidoreductase (fatty acid repression mutant protein)